MVKYITYQDKKLPLLISFSVLYDVEDEFGKDADYESMKVLAALFYYGVAAGCAMKKIDMPFGRDEVKYVLNECFKEFKDIIPEFMAEFADDETDGAIDDTKKN